MTSRYHIGTYWRLKVLKSYMAFKRKDFVLDAGCSDGYIASEISKIGCNIVAVDVSKDIIDLNVARRDKNIRYCVADLQFIDKNKSIGNFTKIICLDVLEHVLNAEGVIKALCKIADERCCIYITVPLSDTHGHFNITLDRLTAVLTSNYFKSRVEKIKPSFSFYIAKKIHSFARNIIFRKTLKIDTFSETNAFKLNKYKILHFLLYIPSIFLRIIADTSPMPFVKGEDQLIVIATRE